MGNQRQGKANHLPLAGFWFQWLSLHSQASLRQSYLSWKDYAASAATIISKDSSNTRSSRRAQLKKEMDQPRWHREFPSRARPRRAKPITNQWTKTKAVKRTSSRALAPLLSSTSTLLATLLVNLLTLRPLARLLRRLKEIFKFQKIRLRISRLSIVTARVQTSWIQWRKLPTEKRSFLPKIMRRRPTERRISMITFAKFPIWHIRRDRQSKRSKRTACTRTNSPAASLDHPLMVLLITTTKTSSTRPLKDKTVVNSRTRAKENGCMRTLSRRTSRRRIETCYKEHLILSKFQRFYT